MKNTEFDFCMYNFIDYGIFAIAVQCLLWEHFIHAGQNNTYCVNTLYVYYCMTKTS